MNATLKNQKTNERKANVLQSIESEARKEKLDAIYPKKTSILIQSNDIAKQEYSLSQFWNKIQKDRNDCYIALAFQKLYEKETERHLSEVKNLPYFVVINHFLTLYNIDKKFPLKIERTTWYSFAKFLFFVANLSTEKFNYTLNFGLKHSPKKD